MHVVFHSKFFFNNLDICFFKTSLRDPSQPHIDFLIRPSGVKDPAAKR